MNPRTDTFTWIRLPSKRYLVVNLTLHHTVATVETRTGAQLIAEKLNGVEDNEILEMLKAGSC